MWRMDLIGENYGVLGFSRTIPLLVITWRLRVHLLHIFEHIPCHGSKPCLGREMQVPRYIMESQSKSTSKSLKNR